MLDPAGAEPLVPSSEAASPVETTEQQVLETPTPSAVPESLSSSDVIELTRLANSKARIIEHTQLLESRPKIKVFDGFKTMEGGLEVVRTVNDESVARSKQIREWVKELEEIEVETERFNGADMNRVRTVAKAASERHMSPRDTDLIEITLDTIIALEKLLHLLNARRVLLDLSTTRAVWEEKRHMCWVEHFALTDAVDSFVRVTARWETSFPGNDAAGGSSSPTTSRRFTFHQDASSTSVENLDSHDPRSSPVKSSRSLPQNSRSHQLLTERLEIEFSRLAARIRSFADLVARSATALDAVIEQMQVPDAFLDEQDRLENLAAIASRRGSFVASLAAQWRQADSLLNSCISISAGTRELTTLIDAAKGERPTREISARFSSSAAELTSRLSILTGHDPSAHATLSSPMFAPDRMLPRPTDPDWPDQMFNNTVSQQLLSKELNAAARRVRRVLTAVTSFERILFSYDCASGLAVSLRDATDCCRRIEQLAQHGWAGEHERGEPPDLQTLKCLEDTKRHTYFATAITDEHDRLQALRNRASTQEHDLSVATLECVRHGLTESSFQADTATTIAAYTVASDAATKSVSRALKDSGSLSAARQASSILSEIAASMRQTEVRLMHSCASAQRAITSRHIRSREASASSISFIDAQEANADLNSLQSQLTQCDTLVEDFRLAMRTSSDGASPGTNPIVVHLTERCKASHLQLQRLSALISWNDSAAQQADSVVRLAVKYTALHADGMDLRRHLEAAMNDITRASSTAHSTAGTQPIHPSIPSDIMVAKETLDRQTADFFKDATDVPFLGSVPAIIAAGTMSASDPSDGVCIRSIPAIQLNTEGFTPSTPVRDREVATVTNLMADPGVMASSPSSSNPDISSTSNASIVSMDEAIRKQVNEMCASLAKSQEQTASALDSARDLLEKRRQAEQESARKGELFEQARSAAESALQDAYLTYKERSDGFDALLEQAPIENGNDSTVLDNMSVLTDKRSSVTFPRYRDRGLGDLRAWRDESRDVLAQHRQEIRSRLDTLKVQQQRWTAHLFTNGQPFVNHTTPPGKSLTSSSIKLLNAAGAFDQKVERLLRDFEESIAQRAAERRQASAAHSDTTATDDSMTHSGLAAGSDSTSNHQNGSDNYKPAVHPPSTERRSKTAAFGGSEMSQTSASVNSKTENAVAATLNFTSKLSDHLDESDVFGPAEHPLSANMQSRTGSRGLEIDSDVNMRIQHLLLQLRGGEVEEQADVTTPRSRLLALPNEQAADRVKLEWTSSKVEYEAVRVEPSVSAPQASQLRMAMERRGPQVNHFVQLATFATAFNLSQEALSKLLDAIDEAAGTSVMHSSPGPEQDTSVVGISDHKREMPLTDLCNMLSSVEPLIERTREVADVVARDVRVRDGLAKIERLWRELSTMAQEALDPTLGTGPEEAEHLDDDFDIHSVLSASSSAASVASSEERRTPGNDESRSDASSVKSAAAQEDSNPFPLRVSPQQVMTTPLQRPGRRVVSDSTPASARKHSGGLAFDYTSPYAMSKMPRSVSRPSIVVATPALTKPPSRIPRRTPTFDQKKPSSRKASVSTRPNHYRPNPKSKLDKAVARIVNHLPVPVTIAHASVGPYAKPSDSWKDESGRYWVGDPDPKLCFCRILRSRTVMVRVGGGWQELQSYLYSRYSHLAASVDITSPIGTTSVQISPPDSRSSGLPWLSSASMRKSPSASSGMLEPTTVSRRSLTAVSINSSSPLERRRRVGSEPDLSSARQSDCPVPALPTMGTSTEQWSLDTPSRRRPHSPEIARLKGESSPIGRRSPGLTMKSRSRGSDLAPPVLQNPRRASASRASEMSTPDRLDLLGVSATRSVSSLLVPRRSPAPFHPRSRHASNASNVSEGDRTIEAPQLVLAPSGDANGTGKSQKVVIVQPRKSSGGIAARPMWR